MKILSKHISSLIDYNELSIVRPYLIAEAGVNHEGNLDNAKKLIDEAKEGGADAIKFQSYKAEKLASKNSPSYWDTSKEKTTSQFKLFKKYDNFNFDDYVFLKEYCDSSEIEFLSTPFDTDSALFLNDLMEVYKISSSDITNKPFIDFICKFNKPIILSTGASDLSEIKNAYDWIKNNGNDLVLLHCILNYPTENKNANLMMINGLKKEFPNTPIGYSDHTIPNDMQILETATLLGSAIIEKHFTTDKTLPGNDHYHAMDKADLKLFNRKLDELFLSLGTFKKKPLKSESISRKNARRSLVANRYIKKGEVIKNDMITWKRPGHGIQPFEYDNLLGKIAIIDIEEDMIFQWNMFNE